MKTKLLLFYFILGIANYAHSAETTVTAKSSFVAGEPPATATTAVSAKATADSALATETTATTAATATVSAENNADSETPAQTKDKRQIGRKDTAIYPNHRSSASSSNSNSDSNDDDPEVPQETIYGAKPNQFLIRPIAPHQHQQHEEHQQHQAHLRNYPATIRPHSTQLLEQSQEIQHYAYLQEISRNQPKASIAAQLVGKSHTSGPKKGYRPHTQPPAPSPSPYGNDEDAEQRYVVAVQPQQQAQQQPRHYQPPITPTIQSFQIPQALPPQQKHHRQQQQQHNLQQQQGQPQYQIIPEDQFLRLIEEELQARAFHEAHYRQQIQQQQQQQQQVDADRDGGAEAAATNKAQQRQEQHHQQQQHQTQTERSGPGLGQYRQRIAVEPTATAEYVQYVPRHRGGPKYLPLSQSHSPPQPAESQTTEEDEQLQQQQQQLQQQQQQLQQLQQLQQQQPHPDIPPQLAYYQPQLSSYGGYKTLPNHPLAKSSLENEIEKLLAANKPSTSGGGDTLRLVDNSNEPSALVRHHHLQPQQQAPPPPQPQPQRAARPIGRLKTAAYSGSTPNSLLDANKQPFIPSLFQFSTFQSPTPIYPTPLPQQSPSGDSMKLGPVVYPTQPSGGAQIAPSQYYYQEAAPSAKPKPYRPKHHGAGGSSNIAASKQQQQQQKLQAREKDTLKYTQAPLIYADYDRQQQSQTQSQTGPVQFHPSPPDPTKQHQQQEQQQASLSLSSPPPRPTPSDFRQYVLPAPAPSQSSIFVSQGTGITTPSRPTPTAAAVHASTSHKPKTVEDVKQLHLPQPGGKPLTQAEFQALLDAGYPVTAVPVPVPVPYEQYIKEHPDYRSPPVDYAHLMRFAQQQFAPHHRQLALLQLQRPLGVASEPSVKIISAASPRHPHLRGADAKRQPRQQLETKVEGSKNGAQH